jgi:hypothetical protein
MFLGGLIIKIPPLEGENGVLSGIVDPSFEVEIKILDVIILLTYKI